MPPETDQTISPAFRDYLDQSKDADVLMFWDSDHSRKHIRNYAMRDEALRSLAKNGVKTLFLEMPREFNDTLEKFNRNESTAAECIIELRGRFKASGYTLLHYNKNGVSASKSETETFFKNFARIIASSRLADISVLGADALDLAAADMLKRYMNDQKVADYIATEKSARPGKAAVIYGVNHGAYRLPRDFTTPPLPQLSEKKLGGAYAELKTKMAKEYDFTVNTNGSLSAHDAGGIDDGLARKGLKVAQAVMADGAAPKEYKWHSDLAVFDVSKGAFTQGFHASTDIKTAAAKKAATNFYGHP